MKILYTILFVSFSIILNAQNVSDYKFIVVPKSFSDFETNQYKLNNYLKLLLTQKDYKVLAESSVYWPKEAKTNPCTVLYSDLHIIKSLLKNKLNLVFTDCNKRNVVTYEGVSEIKEFEKGYQDALRKAMKNVSPQQITAVEVQKKDKKITLPPVTPSNNLENKVEKKDEPKKSKISNKFNRYTYDNNNFYVTALENQEFTLTKESNSEVIAHFYPSSIKNVYHVKVKLANQKFYYTIGYYDANTLWYETKKENDMWSKIEFEKVNSESTL